MSVRQQHTLEDLMSTALITVRPHETIADADVEMHLASIRHILVVDSRNRLVGLVSQRDILRALARTRTGSVPVRDVMTTGLMTVGPDTEAADAAEIMLEHKIGCLPVVGEDGELIGVVTESDFVRLAADVLRGARPARGDRARRTG